MGLNEEGEQEVFGLLGGYLGLFWACFCWAGKNVLKMSFLLREGHMKVSLLMEEQ